MFPPDEEDGSIVPHQVPVPFLSVELYSESPGVSEECKITSGETGGVYSLT